MRILQAPSNVANQAWAVAQGLRAHGHEVEVWHYGPNPYGFRADRTIDISDDPKRAVDLFVEALERDFDVFHFHFARSLVPAVGGLPWFWDLPVLRALGKPIVFTFHGSDVRKRSVHLEEDPWSYYRFADVDCDEERIDKALAVIRTYASQLIVASPLNLTFVPDAAYVPKAIELDAFAYVGPKRSEKPLVVHAPSRRATKGSDLAIRGLDALKARGVDFDYRLIEGVPHDELRSIYADADVVVDNLLLGDAEVSALEAMALGKPVVTRIRDDVRAAHPDVPAVHADPDTFEKAVEPLLRDAEMRRRIGEEGRAYVERNHAADVVAKQLLSIYSQPVRPSWRVFPDWTGLSGDRLKLETYEEKIRSLEVRGAELKRALEERNRTVAELKGMLQGTPLAKAMSAARYGVRRARRGAGGAPKKSS